MKKYLVFLAGMAAQEIEAESQDENLEWVHFFVADVEVARFKREQVLGWRVIV